MEQGTHDHFNPQILSVRYCEDRQSSRRQPVARSYDSMVAGNYNYHMKLL